MEELIPGKDFNDALAFSTVARGMSNDDIANHKNLDQPKRARRGKFLPATEMFPETSTRLSTVIANKTFANNSRLINRSISFIRWPKR